MTRGTRNNNLQSMGSLENVSTSLPWIHRKAFSSSSSQTLQTRWKKCLIMKREWSVSTAVNTNKSHESSSHLRRILLHLLQDVVWQEKNVQSLYQRLPHGIHGQKIQLEFFWFALFLLLLTVSSDQLKNPIIKCTQRCLLNSQTELVTSMFRVLFSNQKIWNVNRNFTKYTSQAKQSVVVH